MVWHFRFVTTIRATPFYWHPPLASPWVRSNPRSSASPSHGFDRTPGVRRVPLRVRRVPLRVRQGVKTHTVQVGPFFVDRQQIGCGQFGKTPFFYFPILLDYDRHEKTKKKNRLFWEFLNLYLKGNSKSCLTFICSKYSLSYVFVWNSCFCSLNTMVLCRPDAMWFLLCTNRIYTCVLKKSYFTFPTTKGSANALMERSGFSTSKG